MKVLGIDTSGYANAVGIIDGDTVLTDFIHEVRTDSLEKIVANIDRALKDSGLVLDDIDGIGVGLGPGSWTGIRIGVTVGKVLAYSTGKPVAGVPTLDALAFRAWGRNLPVCAVISMGTGDNVYAATYRVEEAAVHRTSDYYIGNIQGLEGITGEPTVIIGAEAEAYRHEIGEAGKAFIEVVCDVPHGAAVAALAAAHLKREDSDDVLGLTPLYLKESTARAFKNRYTGDMR
jgi:tRNA threonylcarbamoyladenosine biosynthesis protein TsaB